MASVSPKPSFFEFEKEGSDFQVSFTRTLQELNQQIVHNRIPSENTQHFSHGRTWVHAANQDIGSGEMRSMSAEINVSFNDIIDNNLNKIPEAISQVLETFRQQFAAALYSTISEACERSGNVVSAQTAGSFAASFMDAIKKIEFGVNRDGKVSLPEIHIGHDPQEIIAELEAQPPEYHLEFERIKSEKIAEALERETIRKSRFKQRPV